jgi:hypothetical protein
LYFLWLQGVVPIDHYRSNRCLLDCPCKDDVKCCRTTLTHVTVVEDGVAVSKLTMDGDNNTSSSRAEPRQTYVVADGIRADGSPQLPQPTRMSGLSHVPSHVRSVPTLNAASLIDAQLSTTETTRHNRNCRPKSVSNFDVFRISSPRGAAVGSSMPCLDEDTSMANGETSGATTVDDGGETCYGIGAASSARRQAVAPRCQRTDVDPLDKFIKRMSRELETIRGDSAT